MALDSNTSIAIIHNHWIHYKHLLFTAMSDAGVNFIVYFTAYYSKERLAPKEKTELRYSFRLLEEHESYERARQIICAIRLWRMLQRQRPTSLVVGGWYDLVAWSAWLWGLSHRVRMVLWAESNAFDHTRVWWKERMKSIYVKRYAVVHVYGRSNAEYIATLGFPEHRIVTTRAVLDVTHFRLPNSLLKKEGPLRLLYVGRFSPEKNLARLIEAMSTDGAEEILLDLVGYGSLEGDLRQLVKRSGVERRVAFRGKVDQERLPEEYWKADVFVLPSLTEPWGLVANEAMCCGLPVALSSRCGCAEDLVTPETGWKFDPLDKDQMAEVMRAIAGTERSRLAEMGRQARKIAEAYSPENCARIVVKSLADLPGES